MRNLLALLTLLAAVTGCRATHLGAGHGKSYRAAFEAQAQRSARSSAPLNARDAAEVVEAKHADNDSSSSSGTGSSSSSGIGIDLSK